MSEDTDFVEGEVVENPAPAPKRLRVRDLRKQKNSNPQGSAIVAWMSHIILVCLLLLGWVFTKNTLMSESPIISLLVLGGVILIYYLLFNELWYVPNASNEDVIIVNRIPIFKRKSTRILKAGKSTIVIPFFDIIVSKDDQEGQ